MLFGKLGLADEAVSHWKMVLIYYEIDLALRLPGISHNDIHYHSSGKNEKELPNCFLLVVAAFPELTKGSQVRGQSSEPKCSVQCPSFDILNNSGSDESKNMQVGPKTWVGC